MDCDVFNAQLPSAILDRGQNGPRAAVTEHAAGCMNCRRTLQRWEDAQRAIESALSANKIDPNHLRRMAESLYAERFGIGLELKAPLSPAAPSTALPTPLLLAAAAGMLLGYLTWGTGNQADVLSQLLLQQALTGAPFGGGWFPGVMGTSGGLVRDVFAICLVIWISRSRLWSALFPVSPPHSLYIARRAAILLVIVGIYKIAGDALVGPVSGLLGSTGLGSARSLAGAIPVLAIGWLLASAAWRVGFWILVFGVLFIVIENLSLAYLKTDDPSSRRGRH